MFMIFYFLIVIKISNCQFSSLKYRRYPNYIVKSSIVSSTLNMSLQAYDAIYCLSVCSKKEKCWTVYYHKQNLNCTLYPIMGVENLVLTSDSNSLIFMKPW